MKRFLLILTFVLCYARVQAGTLHVPSEQYSTIQSAIIAAGANDTIIVDPNTYYENINFMGKAVTVRSADPNDPDVVAATIIDGNKPIDANFASVVTFNSGEDNRAVLTGFTITGGTGSWAQIYWQYKGYLWNRCGGGVLCLDGSSPTIIKNVFRDNLAGQGGGIYFYNHSNPIVRENTFINNVATRNHGLDNPDPDDPNVYDHGDGGAIVGFQYCDAIITGNLIENNHADFYGGGIHLRQWSDGLIAQNHIHNNNSRLGGGVHITYTSSPTVRDNLIESNEAGTFGGGGIYVYSSSNPIIERNVIRHNRSSRGAGIAVMSNSGGVISTNLITDNFEGGGIICVGTSPEIIHNTIVNNTAGWYSGGIHCEYGASPLIEHNIISSNGDGYGIYVYDDSAPSEPTIRFNNIWNHPLGDYDPDIGDQTGVNGNISAEPIFVDAEGEDYHLSVKSPCINAGDPNYAPLPDETDFEGGSRLLGQYIDIGAYEAWPVQNITNGTKYTVIQDAIDDANDGDTIIVGRGRYYETISFGAHQIVLRSGEPNDWEAVEQTIIDANQTGTAVTISGGQDANTVFSGFTITGGDATNGHAGGIWCYASPRIERNIITNNYAYYKGGGMYFWNSPAAAIVRDNRIIFNTAQYAGGVFCDTSSQPRVENNFIGYNTATGSGGGICWAKNSTGATLSHNIIACNRAAASAGGVSLSQTPVNVSNNLIMGNAAGTYGGAVVIYYGDPNVVNNTIVHNKAPQAGGIYCGSKTEPLLANNIVAFCPEGEGIYGFYDPCVPGMEAAPEIFYSDVFGNADGNYGGSITDQTGSNGNISDDPNFTAAGYWDPNNTPADSNDDFYVPGNYHIPPDSPCVNVGDNSFVLSILAGDIDGEQRIFEDTVDMGADEVVKNPADFNTDGIIDLLDIFVLADEWLSSGIELQSDLYDDDFIDLVDFSILAAEWLWEGGWYQ